MFCPFLCSFWRNFMFWICCCWETARFCLEFTGFFLFVYFLYVGIPILKIVLSHTDKWLVSDVILLKLSFLLSWALLGVQAWWMGKHYPKMQCSITIVMLSSLRSRTKIALTGVCSRVSITDNLILLTLYFLLKLTPFLVKSAFWQLMK